MVRRYYDLPSLTTLAVFEASARHLSFKLAAAELNVTPGAVEITAPPSAAHPTRLRTSSVSHSSRDWELAWL